MSSRKFLKQIKLMAEEFGREVEFRKNHLALICPRGERHPVFTSKTPSDYRAIQNIRKDLKHND